MAGLDYCLHLGERNILARQLAYQGQERPVAGSRQDIVVRLLSVDEAEQESIVAAWNDLALSAVEPNVFHESWFLLPALRLFARKGQPRIFTLWDSEAADAVLLGLLPLCDAWQYGRWPLKHCQNWLHPNAFLGAPLVRSGYEEVFWQRLLDAQDKHGRPAIFLHLNGLTIGGPLQHALDGVCEAQRRNMSLVHRQERAFLAGDIAPDAYFAAAMRAKKRKELRRQKNRLGELGELSFTRHDGSHDLNKWIGEFLALERRGWKGENGSALDCAADTRTLFREVIEGAAAAGKLELLDLRLDGKPLAMLVNFICAPGSFSFKTAFDEDYARFSPGVLLQIENLALLERDGIDWCDSCAAAGHPMIDSLWTGRRAIGRYSVAIGGKARRAIFGLLLHAETARMEKGEDE